MIKLRNNVRIRLVKQMRYQSFTNNMEDMEQVVKWLIWLTLGMMMTKTCQPTSSALHRP